MPLTFKELQQIRSSFARTLVNMLHARIDYPKSNETTLDTPAYPQTEIPKQITSNVDSPPRTQQPI